MSDLKRWPTGRGGLRRKTPLKRGSAMKARAPIKKRRSGGPRRGRLVDPEYMAWLATQPPLVCGNGRLTIHHVRRCGEPKNDRRTIPLPEDKHLIQHGPHTSIEALGKEKFEALYGVDLEAAIVDYNRRYEEEMGRADRVA